MHQTFWVYVAEFTKTNSSILDTRTLTAEMKPSYGIVSVWFVWFTRLSRDHGFVVACFMKLKNALHVYKEALDRRKSNWLYAPVSVFVLLCHLNWYYFWCHCFRYRKSFELQPDQYSGMNLAILLVASGKDLGKSEELQRVCEFCLIIVMPLSFTLLWFVPHLVEQAKDTFWFLWLQKASKKSL